MNKIKFLLLLIPFLFCFPDSTTAVALSATSFDVSVSVASYRAHGVATCSDANPQVAIFITSPSGTEFPANLVYSPNSGYDYLNFVLPAQTEIGEWKIKYTLRQGCETANVPVFMSESTITNTGNTGINVNFNTPNGQGEFLGIGGTHTNGTGIEGLDVGSYDIWSVAGPNSSQNGTSLIVSTLDIEPACSKAQDCVPPADLGKYSCTNDICSFKQPIFDAKHKKQLQTDTWVCNKLNGTSRCNFNTVIVPIADNPCMDDNGNPINEGTSPDGCNFDDWMENADGNPVYGCNNNNITRQYRTDKCVQGVCKPNLTFRVVDTCIGKAKDPETSACTPNGVSSTYLYTYCDASTINKDSTGLGGIIIPPGQCAEKILPSFSVCKQGCVAATDAPNNVKCGTNPLTGNTAIQTKYMCGQCGIGDNGKAKCNSIPNWNFAAPLDCGSPQTVTATFCSVNNVKCTLTANYPGQCFYQDPQPQQCNCSNVNGAGGVGVASCGGAGECKCTNANQLSECKPGQNNNCIKQAQETTTCTTGTVVGGCKAPKVSISCNGVCDANQAATQCNANKQCVIGGGGAKCTADGDCANLPAQCNGNQQCVVAGGGKACNANNDCQNAAPCDPNQKQNCACGGQQQCVNGVWGACPDKHTACLNGKCQCVNGNGQNTCNVLGAVCDTNCDGQVQACPCGGFQTCTGNGIWSQCPDNHTDCKNGTCQCVLGQGDNKCQVVGATCGGCTDGDTLGCPCGGSQTCTNGVWSNCPAYHTDCATGTCKCAPGSAANACQVLNVACGCTNGDTLGCPCGGQQECINGAWSNCPDKHAACKNDTCQCVDGSGQNSCYHIGESCSCKDGEIKSCGCDGVRTCSFGIWGACNGTQHRDCLAGSCTCIDNNISGVTEDLCFSNGTCKINQPPIPYNLNVDPGSYCSVFQGGGLATFEWGYRDVENDPETKWQIQISTGSGSDFDNNIVVDSTVLGDANKIQIPVFPASTYSNSNHINYGVDYYWRVKVWESQTNYNSGWVYYSGNYIYPFNHPAPSVICSVPQNNAPGAVSFLDNSICYNDDGTFYLCRTKTSNTYAWWFNLPSFTSVYNTSSDDTIKGDATHTYSQSKTYLTALKVCDDGGCCYAPLSVTVGTSNAGKVPQWWEVSPF